MFVSLLLPAVVPYGCPGTFFDPQADSIRKTEFFMWIASINDRSRQYQHVQLIKSEDIEKYHDTFIEGKQKSQTKFVPSSV
jgi:hypothetical protein